MKGLILPIWSSSIIPLVLHNWIAVVGVNARGLFAIRRRREEYYQQNEGPVGELKEQWRPVFTAGGEG